MTRKTERIETVTAGEVIQIPEGPDRIINDWIVQAPCENKNDGYWFCATHRKAFQNNFQKDSHIHTGRHRMTWMCYQHGPEQP